MAIGTEQASVIGDMMASAAAISTNGVRKPTLALVQSADLSPVQELDIIAYVNFDDGLSSVTGSMITMLEEGMFGIEFTGDPEASLINSLDRVAKGRVVHRAMGLIGEHARTLTWAYLIQPMPAYVQAQFGRQAGIVLAKCHDVEALAQRCKKAALREKPDLDANAHALMMLRIEAVRLYNTACRAYSHEYPLVAAAVKASRIRPALERYAVPHVCRKGSAIHKCPCGVE